MARLDQQIVTIEQRMTACLHMEARLQHRFEQVTAIPGIGPCLGSRWVSIFGAQETLPPRKIASRFGHAPQAQQSGTSRHTPPTSTGQGDRLFRKFMTLAARSAQQHWPKMRAYKTTKQAEGNPTALITNNVINRLIRILCAIWNADSALQPQHVSPFAT